MWHSLTWHLIQTQNIAQIHTKQCKDAYVCVHVLFPCASVYINVCSFLVTCQQSFLAKAFCQLRYTKCSLSLSLHYFHSALPPSASLPLPSFSFTSTSSSLFGISLHAVLSVLESHVFPLSMWSLSPFVFLSIHLFVFVSLFIFFHDLFSSLHCLPSLPVYLFASLSPVISVVALSSFQLFFAFVLPVLLFRSFSLLNHISTHLTLLKSSPFWQSTLPWCITFSFTLHSFQASWTFIQLFSDILLFCYHFFLHPLLPLSHTHLSTRWHIVSIYRWSWWISLH